MKNITLLRHGESLGQTAYHNGIDRQKDPSLHDCFLSQKGIGQACQLRKTIDELHNEEKFELVCVSPLTRAIATCVLGLGHLSETCMNDDDADIKDLSCEGKNQLHHQQRLQGKTASIPFICHPDLAESGGRIPENKGRPIKKVMRTIEENLSFISPSYAAVHSIDFSLLPEKWPRYHGYVSTFIEWLHQRPETNIAVVCHHNVIKALCGRGQVREVFNCIPVQCVLVDGDYRSLHIPNKTWNQTPKEPVQTKSTYKKGKTK